MGRKKLDGQAITSKNQKQSLTDEKVAMWLQLVRLYWSLYMLECNSWFSKTFTILLFGVSWDI